jgi:hypothetical protein
MSILKKTRFNLVDFTEVVREQPEVNELFLTQCPTPRRLYRLSPILLSHSWERKDTAFGKQEITRATCRNI